jgi:hypothetical protein
MMAAVNDMASRTRHVIQKIRFLIANHVLRIHASWVAVTIVAQAVALEVPQVTKSPDPRFSPIPNEAC